MANVHSFVSEPLMTPENENFQHMYFKTTFYPWSAVRIHLMEDDDFGKQLDVTLADENTEIKKTDTLNGKDDTIALIYKRIKSKMQWNNSVSWLSEGGVQKAWKNKTGNSAEINFILYHFLKKAGIDAYPMIVGTADNGGVDRADASIARFNNFVVYIPIDTLRFYVLDASNKYSTYDKVPDELLNTMAFAMDQEHHRESIFPLKSIVPEQKDIYVNADIKPEGKMAGSTQITNSGYSRSGTLKLYDDLGEKKFIDYLTSNNNNLKISSLKLENTKTDTLPLLESINFEMELTESDNQYIYVNTDLFPSFGVNPFLTKERYSDIDFKCLSNYIVTAIYNVPPGYKVDVLPKSIYLLMPDKSISFKRIMAQEDGVISVRYAILRKRSIYLKSEYSSLYEFYKKMYDMLNEQIVLKKL